MPELTEQPSLWPRVAMVAMAAGVFLLDRVTPTGVAIPFLYAAVVPIALWSRHDWDLLVVAITCTALTGLGSAFSPPDTAMRVALANRAMAVVAIWAVWILARRRRRSEKMGELLIHLDELLQGCLTTEEACEVIGRVGPRLFPAEHGSLWAIRQSQKLVEPVAQWSTAHAGVREFPTTGCYALRSGRTYFVEDMLVGPLCNHLATPLPASYICIPLITRGEATGMLHLGHPPSRFPARIDRTLAATAAARIALAMANLEMRAELHTLSVRDLVTGLFNRGYMEESLEREVHRATRHQRMVGVIAIDLNGLQYLNERFGREVGDAWLRQAGRTLQQAVRGSDIVSRSGAEAFTIIMPDTTSAATLQRAEQLRTTLKELREQHQGAAAGPFNCSLGLSLFPDHGKTGKAVLRAAEEASKRAKSSGVDRVLIGEKGE
ncbi:MAG: sensor domain-containing diguanylate cyclase [Nitrospiraceae bacterium]